MSHHHEHSHHHHHHEEASTTKDKLKILLKHWTDHNNAHILEYEKWMKKCKEENLQDQYKILKKIIDKLNEINSLYNELSKLV